MMRFAKPGRLRLPSDQYLQLQQKVLARDGWRCQSCGSRSSLQVHHQQYRSQSGSDIEENLITLCALCHAQVTPARHCTNSTMWHESIANNSIGPGVTLNLAKKLLSRRSGLPPLSTAVDRDVFDCSSNDWIAQVTRTKRPAGRLFPRGGSLSNYR
jgi:hypothetical protein